MGSTIRDDFVKRSKVEEDPVQEKGDDAFGGNRFLLRAKNHPLSKPMVDHNQERIKARGQGEIGDEVTGDLLERARCKGFDRG